MVSNPSGRLSFQKLLSEDFVVLHYWHGIYSYSQIFTYAHCGFLTTLNLFFIYFFGYGGKIVQHTVPVMVYTFVERWTYYSIVSVCRTINFFLFIDITSDLLKIISWNLIYLCIITRRSVAKIPPASKSWSQIKVRHNTRSMLVQAIAINCCACLSMGV